MERGVAVGAAEKEPRRCGGWCGVGVTAAGGGSRAAGVESKERRDACAGEGGVVPTGGLGRASPRCDERSGDGRRAYNGDSLAAAEGVGGATMRRPAAIRTSSTVAGRGWRTARPRAPSWRW